MHAKYLGNDLFIFGSIFYLLCFEILDQDAHSNLQAIWALIKQEYRRQQTVHRFRAFSRLTMFIRKDGVHKLRGKAAEVKALGPVLLPVWTRFADPGSAVHQRVSLLLKLTCRLEELLQRHKDEVVLPAPAARQFADTAFNMCHVQMLLFQHYQAQEDCPCLFNITPKAHMLCHSALLAEHINPRLVWCFGGEAQMQQVQRLLNACASGLGPTASTVKAAVHARLGMHLQFLKHA